MESEDMPDDYLDNIVDTTISEMKERSQFQSRFNEGESRKDKSRPSSNGNSVRIKSSLDTSSYSTIR